MKGLIHFTVLFSIISTCVDFSYKCTVRHNPWCILHEHDQVANFLSGSCIRILKQTDNIKHSQTERSTDSQTNAEIFCKKYIVLKSRNKELEKKKLLRNDMSDSYIEGANGRENKCVAAIVTNEESPANTTRGAEAIRASGRADTDMTEAEQPIVRGDQSDVGEEELPQESDETSEEQNEKLCQPMGNDTHTKEVFPWDEDEASTRTQNVMHGGEDIGYSWKSDVDTSKQREPEQRNENELNLNRVEGGSTKDVSVEERTAEQFADPVQILPGNNALPAVNRRLMEETSGIGGGNYEKHIDADHKVAIEGWQMERSQSGVGPIDEQNELVGLGGLNELHLSKCSNTEKESDGDSWAAFSANEVNVVHNPEAGLPQNTFCTNPGNACAGYLNNNEIQALSTVDDSVNSALFLKRDHRPSAPYSPELQALGGDTNSEDSTDNIHDVNAIKDHEVYRHQRAVENMFNLTNTEGIPSVSDRWRSNRIQAQCNEGVHGDCLRLDSVQYMDSGNNDGGKIQNKGGMGSKAEFKGIPAWEITDVENRPPVITPIMETDWIKMDNARTEKIEEVSDLPRQPIDHSNNIKAELNGLIKDEIEREIHELTALKSELVEKLRQAYQKVHGSTELPKRNSDDCDVTVEANPPTELINEILRVAERIAINKEMLISRSAYSSGDSSNTTHNGNLLNLIPGGGDGSTSDTTGEVGEEGDYEESELGGRGGEGFEINLPDSGDGNFSPLPAEEFSFESQDKIKNIKSNKLSTKGSSTPTATGAVSLSETTNAKHPTTDQGVQVGSAEALPLNSRKEATDSTIFESETKKLPKVFTEPRPTPKVLSSGKDILPQYRNLDIAEMLKTLKGDVSNDLGQPELPQFANQNGRPGAPLDTSKALPGVPSLTSKPKVEITSVFPIDASKYYDKLKQKRKEFADGRRFGNRGDAFFAHELASKLLRISTAKGDGDGVPVDRKYVKNVLEGYVDGLSLKANAIFGSSALLDPKNTAASVERGKEITGVVSSFVEYVMNDDDDLDDMERNDAFEELVSRIEVDGIKSALDWDEVEVKDIIDDIADVFTAKNVQTADQIVLYKMLKAHGLLGVLLLLDLMTETEIISLLKILRLPVSSDSRGRLLAYLYLWIYEYNWGIGAGEYDCLNSEEITDEKCVIVIQLASQANRQDFVKRASDAILSKNIKQSLDNKNYDNIGVFLREQIEQLHLLVMKYKPKRDDLIAKLEEALRNICFEVKISVIESVPGTVGYKGTIASRLDDVQHSLILSRMFALVSDESVMQYLEPTQQSGMSHYKVMEILHEVADIMAPYLNNRSLFSYLGKVAKRFLYRAVDMVATLAKKGISAIISPLFGAKNLFMSNLRDTLVNPALAADGTPTGLSPQTGALTSAFEMGMHDVLKNIEVDLSLRDGENMISRLGMKSAVQAVRAHGNPIIKDMAFLAAKALTVGVNSILDPIMFGLGAVECASSFMKAKFRQKVFEMQDAVTNHVTIKNKVSHYESMSETLRKTKLMYGGFATTGILSMGRSVVGLLLSVSVAPSGFAPVAIAQMVSGFMGVFDTFSSMKRGYTVYSNLKRIKETWDAVRENHVGDQHICTEMEEYTLTKPVDPISEELDRSNGEKRVTNLLDKEDQDPKSVFVPWKRHRNPRFMWVFIGVMNYGFYQWLQSSSGGEELNDIKNNLGNVLNVLSEHFDGAEYDDDVNLPGHLKEQESVVLRESLYQSIGGSCIDQMTGFFHILLKDKLSKTMSEIFKDAWLPENWGPAFDVTIDSDELTTMSQNILHTAVENIKSNKLPQSKYGDTSNSRCAVIATLLAQNFPLMELLEYILVDSKVGKLWMSWFAQVTPPTVGLRKWGVAPLSSVSSHTYFTGFSPIFFSAAMAYAAADSDTHFLFLFSILISKMSLLSYYGTYQGGLDQLSMLQLYTVCHDEIWRQLQNLKLQRAVHPKFSVSLCAMSTILNVKIQYNEYPKLIRTISNENRYEELWVGDVVDIWEIQNTLQGFSKTRAQILKRKKKKLITTVVDAYFSKEFYRDKFESNKNIVRWQIVDRRWGQSFELWAQTAIPLVLIKKNGKERRIINVVRPPAWDIKGYSEAFTVRLVSGPAFDQDGFIPNFMKYWSCVIEEKGGVARLKTDCIIEKYVWGIDPEYGGFESTWDPSILTKAKDIKDGDSLNQSRYTVKREKYIDYTIPNQLRMATEHDMIIARNLIDVATEKLTQLSKPIRKLSNSYKSRETLLQAGNFVEFSTLQLDENNRATNKLCLVTDKDDVDLSLRCIGSKNILKIELEKLRSSEMKWKLAYDAYTSNYDEIWQGQVTVFLMKCKRSSDPPKHYKVVSIEEDRIILENIKENKCDKFSLKELEEKYRWADTMEGKKSS